jgi:eukaryotic-like serine/threonine-protein kinase
LTPEQWQDVWAVFRAAAEVPTTERTVLVESRLADPHLRGKVDELLDELNAPSDEPPSDEATPENEPHPDWPRLGQTLGRFELRSPLGRGGMGDVYRAYDPSLHRDVAIKCVAPANLGSSNAIADFLREARAASALNHPGIVTVYEVVRTDDNVAIVMELVDGDSLRRFTAERQPIGKVAHWGRQIAEALAASHKRGIIHRDVKPENLIVRKDGYCKILDFGLAAERGATTHDLPVGTVRYMSPEQSRAATLTAATDVFSLGVVLFELATGVHPFAPSAASDTTMSVAQAINQCDADPPSWLREGIPPRFDKLVRAMLAKDPALRPSAEDVAQELAGIAGEKRGGSRAWLWIATAIAIVAIVLAVRSALTPRSAPFAIAGVQIVPFTSFAGSESQPAFSPDGSKIAFVWTGEHGGGRDIYVKGVADGQLTRLTTDPAEDMLPTFSPDGKRIAFLRQISGSSEPEVVIMNSDGSGERSIARIAPSFGFVGLAWFPDGNTLLVRDGNSSRASLFRLGFDGSRQQMTFPPQSGADGRPKFSPNGKWLAYIRYSAAAAQICIRPTAAPLTNADRCLDEAQMSDLAWMPDNKSILYAGTDALWRVNVEGSPQPERMLAGNFAGLTIDRTGKRIAFTRSFSDGNIWRIARDGKNATKLIASSGEDSSPSVSPDGKRIAVRSNRSGSFELYSYAIDGSDEKRITNFGAHIDNPSWSPDGAWIAFDGNRATIDSSVKHHNIYVVPSAGGVARQITDDAVHYEEPSWSRDGRWIYYLKEANPEETWKVPFEGGAPLLVDSQPMEDRIESGDSVYYVRYTDSPGIRRRRIADGLEEILPGTQGVHLFRYWSLVSDGSRDGIYFVPGPPEATLLFLDLHTNRVSRVADLPVSLFKGPRGLSASQDGKWIFYCIDDLSASDIMLATMK